MAEIVVNTDGGARGNPGPAAIGVVMTLPTGEVISKKRYIGRATNNQAEYRALIWAGQMVTGEVKPSDRVVFQLDSELVVKQMRGEYKVKDADLAVLKQRVDQILAAVDFHYEFKHVRRTSNKAADKLVNEALDNHE